MGAERFPVDLRWDAVEVTDGEKNEAVNEIERRLAAWRKRTASVEAPAQPESETEETRCSRR